MKNKYVFIIFIISMMMINCSYAQEQSAIKKQYSLQECIDIALENNSNINIFKNNMSSAENRLISAKSDYYPTAALRSNLYIAGTDNTDNRTNLSITQNIYDSGLRETKVKSAKYALMQNDAGYARLVQTITYNVSVLYYNVLRLKQLADVAEASVRYNEELKQQIQARVDVGDAAQVDILPVNAQLANAKVSLLSAKNNVNVALIQLQNTLGLNTTSNFDVKNIEENPSYDDLGLGKSIDAALNNRPDLRQHQASVGFVKAAEKIANMALRPQLSVTAQYDSVLSDGNINDNSVVMGVVSFDIFNGGSNKALYNEAKNNTKNALIEEEQAKKDIAAEVEEGYLNLIDAKERLSASEMSLDAAKINYNAQQERYAQGLGVTLDLLNAEVQVIKAESDKVGALYDYFTAIAQMDYSIGK